MKKIVTFVEISLSVCLCIALIAPQPFAADNEATAKKIADKVPGAAKRPAYYTGKHGFMNDKDQASDNGALEKGLYIMSWLVLNPPVKLGAGGGAASIGKDLYKEYFGIPEADVSKDLKNWPIAGQKSKKPNESKEDMYWIPINHELMQANGDSLGASSGNQFDWKEWGFGGLNQFHEYMFCLVKWSTDTTVKLAAGSDDPEQTWVNGAKVCEGLGDRNWARDTDRGEFNAKGGEWVAIFAEVGENGGEAGYTLRVEPPPKDHTLDIEMAMAVSAQGKLAATWGRIKVSY